MLEKLAQMLAGGANDTLEAEVRSTVTFEWLGAKGKLIVEATFHRSFKFSLASSGASLLSAAEKSLAKRQRG